MRYLREVWWFLGIALASAVMGIMLYGVPLVGILTSGHEVEVVQASELPGKSVHSMIVELRGAKLVRSEAECTSSSNKMSNWTCSFPLEDATGRRVGTAKFPMFKTEVPENVLLRGLLTQRSSGVSLEVGSTVGGAVVGASFALLVSMIPLGLFVLLSPWGEGMIGRVLRLVRSKSES